MSEQASAPKCWCGEDLSALIAERKSIARAITRWRNALEERNRVFAGSEHALDEMALAEADLHGATWNIRLDETQPDPTATPTKAHVELWDAINAVVEASGGSALNVSIARMTAVARVERAIEKRVEELRNTKPSASTSTRQVTAAEAIKDTVGRIMTWAREAGGDVGNAFADGLKNGDWRLYEPEGGTNEAPERRRRVTVISVLAFCGECDSIFYTSVGGYLHTCGRVLR